MKMFTSLLLTCLLACTPSDKGDSLEPLDSPVYPWEECKNELLSHACNFTAAGPAGNEELYQYYRKPIVIEFAAMWCGYCQVAGSEADQVQAAYSQHDLIYVTVLIENFSGEQPTLDDVQSWKDNLGVSNSPVWAASRDLLNSDPALGWQLTGWPTFYFIDRDMVIQGTLRGYSPEALAEGITYITKDDTGVER